MLRHDVVTCRCVSGSVVCLVVRMVVKSIGLEDPYDPYHGNSRRVGEGRGLALLPADMFAACRWSSGFFVCAGGQKVGAEQSNRSF
jgi:hypothetical protein